MKNKTMSTAFLNARSLFRYLQLASVLMLVIACGTTKNKTGAKQSFSDSLSLEVIGIVNLMPGTTSKPYIIVTVSTTDSVFQESFRLKELELKGGMGKWTKTTFDHDYFTELETNTYENVARDFENNIGSPMDAVVTLETASGKTIVLKKKGVSMENVY
jgi:hypothetical protein